MSLSIRPDPGIDGPPVDRRLDAVLARPFHHLAAGRTILDAAEADFAEQLDARARELREIALDHAVLDDGGAGV